MTRAFREPSKLDYRESWLSHLGDQAHYARSMGNWAEVSVLDPQARLLSEAVFGLLRRRGFTEAVVRFCPMNAEYRVSKDDRRFELELRNDTRGRSSTDLLKFVRYVVYTSLGIPYIPDVRCFGERICPSPRARPDNVHAQYGWYKDEDEKRRFVQWTSAGKYKDLVDSVQRIMDMGLITCEDISDSVFMWSSEKLDDRYGWCMMDAGIVVIDGVFDSPDVPDFVMDKTVYHECLHLRQRTKQVPCTGEHDRQFCEWEREFPRLYEAKRIAATFR